MDSSLGLGHPEAMLGPWKKAPLGLVPLLLVASLGLQLTACDGPPSRADASASDLRAETATDVDTQQSDGSVEDAATTADLGADAAAYPAVYGATTLSPLTPAVVRGLQAIAARGVQQDGVFAKIGASATVSSAFLQCFVGSKVDLGAHTALAPSITHFSQPLLDGKTSFDRTSLSATVGWSAGKAISGTPSPLTQEVDAIAPRFAVVMYGTNDIQLNNIFGYADNMLTLTDQLIARGVIPVLTTIMPRDDSASADLQVPRYNAVLRAVAQARQIPLIDYHRELVMLPDHGLGPDNLHPSSYSGGACQLTAAGLASGYNIRNLLTLQTLDRLRRVLVASEVAPDPPGKARQGQGSAQDPIIVEGFPFVDVRDTTRQGERRIDSYPGCAASQDESGPELIYRLTLTQQTTLRALVFDRGDVDIDLHLLGATVDGASCVQRNDRELSVTLAAGTHHLALDTFVSSGVEKGGEYLLVLLAE